MNRTRLDAFIERLEGIDHLTRENLEELQLHRLNEMLSRMRESKDHYQNLPEKLDCLSDLKKLPFTTAQMLAEHPGRYLLTSQRDVSRVISGATSGTTGPAKRVFYTETDTAHTVWLFEAGIGEMLKPGEKCFIAFPFTGPFGLGDLIAQAVENLDGIPIRAGFGQTWGEVLDLIRETEPETYIGFPVALLSLARLWGDDFPIQRALISADACPDGVMAELEKALGSKLYPHYGSRECGLGGAVTCPAFEGTHLRENHIIPEIIDENGNVLPDGEYGELVLTTIGLEAMPLIRYRTGDYTRILPPCPCGGVTRRLDMVSRREGNISMEALDSVLFRIPELVDYRVSFDGALSIDAFATQVENVEDEIRSAVGQIYPHLEARISIRLCCRSQRPAYLGKRHMIECPEKSAFIHPRNRDE